MRRLALVAASLVLASGCAANSSPGASQPSLLAAPPSTSATHGTLTQRVSEPSRIRIPSIGVDARIVRVGLKANGDMETPSFGHAGWYSKGPRPGEDGPAVVIAHVDSKTGPDVFARLKTLKVGGKKPARIYITDKAGKTYEFVAGRKQQTAKTALPAKAIWGKTDGPALRLITCGGAFDKATSHYVANVIVWADAV